MEKTKNYDFNIPAPEDYYDVEHYNANFRRIDEQVKNGTQVQASIDAAYANGNKYTDNKIAALINGAPEAMDTIRELADAIASNKTIMDALTEAIGKKAAQAELDTHTGNGTVHITASERTRWNSKQDKITVDAALNGSSTNPLQNKVVTEKINKINSDLGGLRFGVDADGNYGYKKAGADTVTPFRSKPLIFTTSPVDIKAALPDVYNKLTAADFLMGGTRAVASTYCTEMSATLTSGPGAHPLPTTVPSCSYNSTTGILTFATSLHDDFINYWGGADYGNLDMTGIFAVYRGTIGGK